MNLFEIVLFFCCLGMGTLWTFLNPLKDSVEWVWFVLGILFYLTAVLLLIPKPVMKGEKKDEVKEK